MKYLAEPLSSAHKKDKFKCGIELLDNYLKRQAKQDVKKKHSVCFVYTNESDEITGYYTLSGNSISNDLIPDDFRKKLPKSYKSIPVILLGRLAVDAKLQGKGIGKLLLIDALKKSYDASNTIGAFAVVVDPIDKQAELFYEKFGFIKLPDSGKMFLPMKIIKQLFQ